MPSTFGTYTDAYALAEAIARLCEDPHPEKDGWRARCPNHQGKSDTSLSLTPNDDRDRVLLNCFGGCAPTEIVRVLGLTMADLFLKNGSVLNGQKHIVKEYDYYNASGTLVHQTVRYEPKAFRQRRPDPAHPGTWIWDLKTIQTVLYNLPAVLVAVQAGEIVYICEGEKDADALITRALAATTCPMGAGKWRKAYSEVLRRAHVVLLPHNDAPGQQHVLKVAAELYGVATTIKVVSGLFTDVSGSDISDWLAAGGTQEAFDAYVHATPIYGLAQPQAPHTPPSTSVGWSIAGVSNANLALTVNTRWRDELFSKKNGDLTYNEFNVTHILQHHDYWQHPENLFWYDAIRERRMCGDAHITKKLLVDISHWLGGQERLSITSLKLLEDCVYARCEATPRDLLQRWLNGLPMWDHTPRLHTWLQDIATVDDIAYTRDISRRLITSLVARALDPGCQYREVVILQGPENIGKSHIAEALVTKEWFVVLSMNLETKESHMMLQHVWLAELADLDSLSRTEDARLKAFITMEEDTYIPKFKSESASFKRRAVLVGTTNEKHFLKGQTGNTRFLPLRIAGPIDLDRLHTMRDQLFAEAIQHYYGALKTWWKMPDEAQETANEERELRRITNEYEQPLHEWLEYGRFAQTIYHDGAAVVFLAGETSWPEIAQWFLKIDTPERWKDKSLQMQIASALGALGWENTPIWRQGRTTKVWQKQEHHVNGTVPF